MSNELHLDRLLDAPILTVAIGGRKLQFSEFPIASLARLQSWLRANVPNPIAAIAPHLEGLPAAERERLLDKAYDEARRWPPDVGSPAASLALMKTLPGQLEVFYEGVRVHQPEIARDESDRIYRLLERRLKKAVAEARRKGEKAVDDGDGGRIMAVLFGYDGLEEGFEPPKAQAADDPTNSTGN